MRDKLTQLVVICPVFNEEKNIDYFFDRLKAVFASVDATRYECSLLFTNNRSTDGTLGRIVEIEKEHPWVNHVTLSRNFGYQLSVLSGLSLAENADIYMVCDVDCEDPPELLPTFLKEIEAGRDLVYGIRNNRPDSWLMAKCRSGFYFVLRSLGDYKIVPYMAEFAMGTRQVREAVIDNVNTFPFIRAEVGYAGFDVLGIPYRREDRQHGATHYNYWGNYRFAIAGILSSTTFPLRASLYLLPALIAVNLGLLALFFSGLLQFQAAMVLLVAINALYSVMALGFQSVYLARTYQNGLGRRRFIVDRARSNLSLHARSAEGVGVDSRGSVSKLLDALESTSREGSLPQ